MSFNYCNIRCTVSRSVNRFGGQSKRVPLSYVKTLAPSWRVLCRPFVRLATASRESPDHLLLGWHYSSGTQGIAAAITCLLFALNETRHHIIGDDTKVSRTMLLCTMLDLWPDGVVAR
jgi:hypothetical protein